MHVNTSISRTNPNGSARTGRSSGSIRGAAVAAPLLPDHRWPKVLSETRALEWSDRAACLGEEPELFFPIGDTSPALLQIEEAKAVRSQGPSMVGSVRWRGSVVTLASAWTGAAIWSGGAYVALNSGAIVSIPVPASDQARNLYPIVNQSQAPAGSTFWSAGNTRLGSTPNGGAGAQGIAGAPGKLFPSTLGRTLPAGATSVVGHSNGTASVDALLIQLLVSTVAVTGPAGNTTLYISSTTTASTRTITVPKGFVAQQLEYDNTGKLVGRAGDASATGGTISVTIPAGGFTVVKLVRG